MNFLKGSRHYFTKINQLQVITKQYEQLLTR